MDFFGYFNSDTKAKDSKKSTNKKDTKGDKKKKDVQCGG